MGFLMGHSAWQIDQFPTCWPMNGLFVHWSRGWGVSSFSERLVRFGVMCCMLSVFHVSSWMVVNIWSVGHPFSFLNSSWGLTGENITRKLLSLSLDLFFKILLFQVSFFIFFSITGFSPYFLLVGLLLQYVALFQSLELVKVSVIVNWCRVAVSNDKSTQWVPSLFCASFLIPFFLKVNFDL